MYIAKNEILKKLTEAFGFDVEVVTSANYPVHGDLRTRYTVRRPNGKKLYHAFMFSNGSVVAV